MIPSSVRQWARNLGYLTGPARYWVRPYDPIADRRRWRWETPSPCGRQFAAGLTPGQLAELRAAVARAQAGDQ